MDPISPPFPLKPLGDKLTIAQLRELIANQTAIIERQAAEIEMLNRRLSTALDKELLLLNKLISD